MKTYSSKFGYETLLFLIFLFSLIGYFSNSTKNGYIGVLMIDLLIIAFLLYLNLSTKYIITETHLHIKCCFLVNMKVPIQSIKKIYKTNNLLSSPAPSLDRIAITFGKWDEVLISPKNKKEFAEDLQKINPTIEVKF